MKTLLTLLMLMIPTSMAQNLPKKIQFQPQKPSPELQKVLAQIHKNSPNLDQNFQMVLAKTIINKAQKYHLSSKVLAAILMQESSYRIDAKNIRCGTSVVTGKEDCIVIDFGIGQINHRTATAFKLDKKKLLSDLEYSVDASAMVLADFKKMHTKDSEFWTRYNSGNKEKRQVYKELVARYM
jgi:Transglycosylase SLT domain